MNRRTKRGPLLPWLDTFNAGLRLQSARYRSAAQRYIEAADAIAVAIRALEPITPSAAKPPPQTAPRPTATPEGT